jgi:D-alanyl-D-alanine carboxypeptidase/D-alanyl-D-alanine-endopeptidase (penicillin-binding protein 4)
MRTRPAIPFLLLVAAVVGVPSGQVAQTPAAEPPPSAGQVAGNPAMPTGGQNETAPQTPPPAPSDEVLLLRSELERLIRNITTAGSDHGVLVMSLDRGDTLFSHNPDVPIAPASNMKLFTTAAALYYLGPNFRYSTYVLADGPIENGVLHGNLILYGTGDPAISSRMLGGALTPFRALADSLRAHGITEVRGDIVGDGSYFDDRFIADGWREEYRLDSYSAPIGALSLAENVVSVRVTPGGATGQPATIQTTPRTTGLLVQNRVTTVGSGSSAIRFQYDPEGLVIEGRIARRHPGVARSVTVVDPANYAAAAFRDVLEDAGLPVGGVVRTVRSPVTSPVVRTAPTATDEGGSPPRIVGTHLSPPLSEVVTVTNHVSQNLFAEAMFKTVGRVALGNGSFEAGSQAVQYFLECEGPFDFSSLQIVDGSGLSPINRVTPRATIHLLDLMTRLDVWETFYRSLPEAASPEGGQHSLRGRMGGTAAARNLRAKTGTIANVSSLSGYVRAANGELLAFSIYANGVRSTATAKRTEDAIGARLASFTRPPEDLSPELIGNPVESTGDLPVGTQANPPLTPAVGTPDSTPDSASAAVDVPVAPATQIHRVVSGETLDGIARRYGITVAELQRLNPGLQPRRLQIGHRLTVPVR